MGTLYADEKDNNYVGTSKVLNINPFCDVNCTGNGPNLTENAIKQEGLIVVFKKWHG